MKKTLSVVLAVILVLPLTVTAFAGNNKKQLSFNEDGKFTIVHLTDIQDGYPLNSTIKTYINEMLDTIKPDLVVLGGDNCVAAHDDKEAAMEELLSIFVEHQTYFTFVFGNHDYQQGHTREELYNMYLKYGGEYCLAYDQVPELHGVATHNLPIYSSDGSKVAFNLFMFDSGSYTYDNGDADLGYDSVHEDQIEWYKSVAEKLKAANGGETVYSMAFQHIIVQEAVEALFMKSPIELGKLGMDFDGVSYTYLPKVGSLEDGWMLEHPCPGYYNYGQLQAMSDEGDVLAVFSGHDHTNNFTLKLKGIDVINSGGCTYNSYGDVSNRGARVIVLNENDVTNYETYTYTLAEAALKDGSDIAASGSDITITGAKLAVAKTKFMTVFAKVLKYMFYFVNASIL